MKKQGIFKAVLYAEEADCGALQKKISEIHAEIVARELGCSAFTPAQKIEILNEMLRLVQNGGE